MNRLLVILILITTLNACNHSGYNANINASQNILPVKSIQIYSDGQIYGGEFEYVGDKIKKTTDLTSNKHALFFYSDKLITTINIYENEKGLKETLRFEYDEKDRLIKETIRNGKKIDYIINTNGTIYAVLNRDTNVIFIKENKIIKEQLANGEIYVYEYDNQFSPLKNIAGMDKLFYSYEFGNVGVYYNIITKKQLNSQNPFLSESKYEYNLNQFPDKETYQQKDKNNQIIDYYNIMYYYNK